MTDPQISSETVPPIDPKLINEIFEMDPLKLSDSNIDLAIAFFRQNREDYLRAPVEKAEKKAKAAKKSIVDMGQIDLEDLGLL